MSNQYLVSARKYRPQTFDTVVGQSHITTTLKNAIKTNHLAHAYLFCGPRGVGKTTCARILAKTINCENISDATEACGTCATCQSFDNHTSFNIFELDAASNNSVDDIRELVNQVRFAPQQGKYKIYIIDEVHMLSAAAFNAFLKTLEEPPPYAIFILATTEKHKILPTILSRCQVFDFKRITTSDVVDHLHMVAQNESLNAEEEALHTIALKSDGCMRDALSLFDRISSFSNGDISYAGTIEHLNILDADFYFSLVDQLLIQDISAVLLNLNGILDKGFEGETVLAGLAGHFRNLLLCKEARLAKLLDVPPTQKVLFYEKAQQVSMSFILSALHLLNDAEMSYKNANNRRMHTEMAMIRLCYLQQALTPPTPHPDLEEKKNRLSELTEKSTPRANVVTAPSRKEQSAPPVENKEQETIAPPPEKVNTAEPKTKYQPTRNTGSKRLSKAMLNSNPEEILAAKKQNNTATMLTLEAAQSAYDAYLDVLYKNGNKHVTWVNMKQVQLEFLPPDEIKLICENEMTRNFLEKEHNQLLEFLRSATNTGLRLTKDVRVNTENVEQTVAELSKSELLEKMKTQNEHVHQLYQALNLSLDY